jgi:uncharacterized protein (DUF1015 family)
MKLIKLAKTDKKAMVDDEDFEKVSRHNWYLNVQGYASTTIKINKKSEDYKGKKVKMHRLIMNAKKGQMVDHIDGCPYNNQKSNLRFCTYSENNRNCKAFMTNKLGVKGVTKRKNYYLAHIRINGKQTFLVSFKTIEEDSESYKQASLKHHGEYSYFNRKKKIDGNFDRRPRKTKSALAKIEELGKK